MLYLKKAKHRNAEQLFIRWDFVNHHKVSPIIKSIEGINYSKTHEAYYLPHSMSSYNKIRAIWLDLQNKKNQTSLKKPKKDNADNTTFANREKALIPDANIKPNIVIVGEIIKIKIDFNKEDVAFIKTLERAYWSQVHKIWICKANIFNLDSIQDHFRFWKKDEFVKIRNLFCKNEFPQKISIYKLPSTSKFVAVKIVGFRADISYVKKIYKRKYDKEFRRWLIPNDKKIINSLIKYYKDRRYEITNRLPRDKSFYYKWERDYQKRVDHLLKGLDNCKENLVKSYLQTLVLQKYSWNTIQNYTVAFKRYLFYMGTFPVQKAQAADVNKYLSHISFKKVSYNELNRHCSAIKFYYEKVLFRPDFEIDKIKRPKKNKTIPKVLSMKQIGSMVEQIENTKHLCMFFLLYNGGLRSGELIKLKLEDILWDRNQIFIQSGKGKKDRIVMLGPKMKEMLEIYVDEYNPSYWLFEGQKEGNPYHASSLRQVIKRTAKKAGIVQKVTTHTIRHCFATHLLERGTNLRLIQELLGHSSIKTTLIYTHITKTSASSVVSPLDLLFGEKEEKKRT